MENTKSIIEKIRKLLALSTSSNPNEAANATSAARRLLLKHGLAMSQLQEETPEIKPTFWRQRRIEAHTIVLLDSATKFTSCAHLVSRSGDHYIVGEEANKASCMVMLDYLFEALERSVSEAQNRRKKLACVEQRGAWQTIQPASIGAKEWSRTYRLGWATQIQLRLDVSAEEDTGEEKSLVVVQDSRVSEFMSHFTDEIGYKANIPKDRLGFIAGFTDAANISLHKQISE